MLLDYMLKVGNFWLQMDWSRLSNTIRSSYLQIFFEISVFKNLANFTGKHQCWSLLLIKLQGQLTFIPPKIITKRQVILGGIEVNQACNLSKERLQHCCVPVKFAKFLKTPFLQNISSGCFCQMKQLLIRNQKILNFTHTSYHYHIAE